MFIRSRNRRECNQKPDENTAEHPGIDMRTGRTRGESRAGVVVVHRRNILAGEVLEVYTQGRVKVVVLE